MLSMRAGSNDRVGAASLILAIVLLVLYAVIWTICLIGWRVARKRYVPLHPTTLLPPTSSKTVPGVTVIRPLCGLDDNLYHTLESTMRLSYPTYEVIFAVQDERDEALPVVRMIMDKCPDVTARVVVDSIKIGVNPKINNLLTPFRLATHDLLWVIDSSISMRPDSLTRAVEAFTGTRICCEPRMESITTFATDGGAESLPLLADDVRSPPARGDVGLVHHVPYAVVSRRTIGSSIEQAFLNTTHAKMYLAINALALDSCVVGKSNLYSRHSISQLTTPAPSLLALPPSSRPTGLPAFSPFLAEDNMLALALWHQLGLRHAMTSDVALDHLSALSLWGYIARRVRWIRVRKRMTPLLAVLIEPFTESILCGAYGAWALHRLFRADPRVVFLVHMVLWLLVDLSVRDALSANVRDSGVVSGGDTAQFVLAWAAREVLTLPIWLYGITSSDVTWRGRRYRIVASGEAICLDEHKDESGSTMHPDT